MRTYVHFMNYPYAYLRHDRKINFKMFSAQHFINEAPENLLCPAMYAWLAAHKFKY